MTINIPVRVPRRLAMRQWFVLTAPLIFGMGKISKPCEVKNSHCAVFDRQQPGIRKLAKGSIGVLPGKAGQASNFFLRKIERRIGSGIELRIEQFGETEGDSCRRFVQTKISNQADVISAPCI